MRHFIKYFEAAVLPFVAAESILIILAVLLQICMKAIPGVQEDAYLLSVFVMAIWGMLFIFWYRREISGEVRGKIQNILNLKGIIHFLFLGIGCQFFFSGLMGLLENQFTELFEHYGNTIDSLLNGNLFLVVLYTVVIAPIAEEVVFRGVILHKASKNIPFWGANVLQAVFFGIYHQNIVQGIYAILIGLLLGLIYRRYHSILASILLHMMINAGAFLLLAIRMTYLCNLVMVLAGAAFILIAVKELALRE